MHRAHITMIVGILATLGWSGPATAHSKTADETKCTDPVWVASISLGKFEPKTYHEQIDLLLKRMEEVAPYQPDIVCLPEIAPFIKARKKPPISEVAEKPLGPICQRFAAFARTHRCYVIIPLYTKENGRYYNAAVLINREGNYVGQYRKMYPTPGEMRSGITPGPTDPPVFETDFGKIGIQICFDLQFFDGFKKLADRGAQIIFWPSAYCGGKALNTVAWMNRTVVVSSTRYDPTKICDIDGEDIASSTQRKRHWVCEPINLNKKLVKTWPHEKKLSALMQAYGQKIHLKIHEAEGWTLVEGLSPDVNVVEILKTYEIEAFRGQNERAAGMYKTHRVHP